MEGFLFSGHLLEEIRSKFDYVTHDVKGKKRLFFENSGGSLRLKSAVDEKCYYERIGECPERYNDIALMLSEVKIKGLDDLKGIIFGGEKEGAIVTELTASQVMFEMTRAILENIPGTNVVTTSLEHPSSFDSSKIFAERNGMELRVAEANPETGGVDTQSIIDLIDKNTALLSVMAASNVTGYIFDLEEIVKKAREVKQDLIIITDAVQHLPHGILDCAKLGIDGANYGAYKHYAVRGCGFGYVSPSIAGIFHNKLEAKNNNEWELGTYVPGNFASVSAVVDYVCWIGSHYISSVDRKELYIEGMEKIHEAEFTLLNYMLDGKDERPGLRRMKNVNVFCDSDPSRDRDLIVAIGFKNINPERATEEYAERGVTVFHRMNNSLYSKRIVESIGLEGVVRVSPIHLHTPEEIDLFLKITEEISNLEG